MNKLLAIIEHKKREIAERKEFFPLSALQKKFFYNRVPVSLHRSLRNAGNIAVIAEIKRKSPSAGIFKSDADPAHIAREYERAGAAAISIVTDERFFGGSLGDLAAARSVTGLPLLRKDFILDEYQVHEAKAYGADALLLVADILNIRTLTRLLDISSSLGLEPLVEVYSGDALKKVDFTRVKTVGINNRDLRSFTVDLMHTKELIMKIPGDVFVISESGMRGPEDLARAKEYGARGVLVGEALMKTDSPADMLKQLMTA